MRLRIVKVGRKHRLLNKARWERQAGEKREELYLAGRTRVPIARAGGARETKVSRTQILLSWSLQFHGRRRVKHTEKHGRSQAYIKVAQLFEEDDCSSQEPTAHPCLLQIPERHMWNQRWWIH